jgi:hypothetical protein
VLPREQKKRSKPGHILSSARIELRSSMMHARLNWRDSWEFPTAMGQPIIDWPARILPTPGIFLDSFSRSFPKKSFPETELHRLDRLAHSG